MVFSYRMVYLEWRCCSGLMWDFQKKKKTESITRRIKQRLLVTNNYVDIKIKVLCPCPSAHMKDNFMENKSFTQELFD